MNFTKSELHSINEHLENIQTNVYYRIYAKFDDQKQFKAIDVNQGYQVGNLIYASLLNELELQKFIEFAKDHKGYQLQAREVSTNKTIKINY